MTYNLRSPKGLLETIDLSNFVLVQREMEFEPVVVKEWNDLLSGDSRGILPRRFIALVPIPM